MPILRQTILVRSCHAAYQRFSEPMYCFNEHSAFSGSRVFCETNTGLFRCHHRLHHNGHFILRCGKERISVRLCGFAMYRIQTGFYCLYKGILCNIQNSCILSCAGKVNAILSFCRGTHCYGKQIAVFIIFQCLLQILFGLHIVKNKSVGNRQACLIEQIQASCLTAYLRKQLFRNFK